MMPESSIIVNEKELQKVGERRIEESYALCPIFPSVQDRYYTKFYYRDPDRERHRDQVLLLHSNRIVLVTLAPKHPLFASPQTSFQVDYRVTPNCDRSRNTSRGKGKRGAQGLDTNANLCIIKPTDSPDSSGVYPVKSLVKGKLLEVNESLIKDPELLRKDPQGSGYIALILPSLPEGLHEIKNCYLTHEEYFKEED